MRIIYVFRRDESILQMYKDARKELQFFHSVHNINMPKSHCSLIICQSYLHYTTNFGNKYLGNKLICL